MLKNNAFHGQDCFQADIGRGKYFVCKLQLIVILVLGINTFTDWVKLAQFRIAIHSLFYQFDIGFVPNQRKLLECEDSVI